VSYNKREIMAVPTYEELLNPALKAVKNLGGSASIQEMVDEVATIMELSDEDLEQQIPSKGTSTFEYRLAWTRSNLKIYGLFDNSERGIWSLTEKGNEIDAVDPEEVTRFMRLKNKKRPKKPKKKRSELEETDEGEEWRAELIEILRKIDPDQFERLCQRMLRESGFSEVEVTGRSGDGGIDGTGIVKLGGLLGFPILFQCKRFKGSVGSNVVRDFRGAMVGRADRGLILTTGVFTRDARQEASRDGAPPIDLVDGEDILDKLRELRLGIEVETVEVVSVKEEWFKGL
jgi:restriction system protein